MKEEKLKQIQQESSNPAAVADIDPPSPPRHELWKRARQKKSGDYTSESSREVAERIDSLVEQSTQGAFVPHGRPDILIAAIGTPEYPGCVRSAGWGVGIRKYFGRLHVMAPPQEDYPTSYCKQCNR